MTQNREGKNASACQRDTNRKQISFTQQNFREAFGLDVPFSTEGEDGNEYIENVCKDELDPQLSVYIPAPTQTLQRHTCIFWRSSGLEVKADNSMRVR